MDDQDSGGGCCGNSCCSLWPISASGRSGQLMQFFIIENSWDENQEMDISSQLGQFWMYIGCPRNGGRSDPSKGGDSRRNCVDRVCAVLPAPPPGHAHQRDAERGRIAWKRSDDDHLCARYRRGQSEDIARLRPAGNILLYTFVLLIYFLLIFISNLFKKVY